MLECILRAERIRNADNRAGVRTMAMTEEKKQIKKACVDVESIDAATALLLTRESISNYQPQTEKKGQSQ